VPDGYANGALFLTGTNHPVSLIGWRTSPSANEAALNLLQRRFLNVAIGRKPPIAAGAADSQHTIRKGVGRKAGVA